MTLRLYRASEVCEMTELQPYVLRSWEKEFPGIGVQRTQDGPKLYRQADVDQVLRIKQLVFGEGLTVAGARRRLEDSGPVAVTEDEVAEVLNTLGSSARLKVASVRDGLKALEAMLTEKPEGGRARPVSTAPGAVSGESEAGRVSLAQADTAERGRGAKAATSTRVQARRTTDGKRRRASA